MNLIKLIILDEYSGTREYLNCTHTCTHDYIYFFANKSK